MIKTKQRPPVLWLFPLVFLAGCTRSSITDSGPEPLVCRASGQDQVFAVAQQVIRRMHFSIDVADCQAGYIKTLPLSGAQGFEFWRSDSVGASNGIEANLQSIRRIAEVTITKPTGQDDNIHINCVVETQRLNLPAREVTSSAQAYRIHSESSKAIQRLKLSPMQERNMVWVNLGPDRRLAQRILDRIRTQLSDAGISVNSPT